MATTRSIVVALRADVSDFRRQMTTAGDDTKKAMDKVGTALGVVGAASAAAVGLSVAKWAEFDQQMSAVQAATHETSSNMDKLSDAAINAGAKTVYSATEAGQAIEELAKAGVSTSDVLGGGLQGALDLASAGTIDVGEAAETAASAMTQFKLSGSAVPHIADLLAAGAGKAQGSVHDMGAALSQAGLVASQTGLSLEETTGGLAAFAAAGLTGSDAGTSLKTMLQALTPSSVQAAQLMKKLGISAYDSQGNFIGLANYAGVLKSGLAGLSVEQQNAAMKTIFGSDAVRAASVLYSDGADGIQSWIDKTNDAGYAQETAATKLDNLKGDLEALSGSWDTAAIKTGQASDGMLRGGVQGLTALINVYADLGGNQQAAVLGAAAVAAGVALLGSAALLAVPKIIEMRAAITTLSTAAPRTASALGTVGKAAGAAGIALAALTAADVLGKQFSGSKVSSIDATSKALLGMGTSLDQVNALIAKTGDRTDANWNFDGLADAAKKISDPNLMGRVSDFVGEVVTLGSSDGSFGRDALVKQLGTIGDSLGQLVTSGDADLAAQQFDQLAAEWEKGGGKVADLKAMMPGYTDALDAASNKQEQAAQTGDQVTSALTGVTGTAQDADQAVSDLSDALDALLDNTFGVEEATDNYQSALLKLSDAAKDNGHAVDGNTEGALANRDALREAVDAGYKQVEAMAKQGASADELTAASAALKQSFIDQATAAGMPKDAIERYAATFDLIPAQVNTTVNANTAEAQKKIDALRAQLVGIGAGVLTDAGVLAASKHPAQPFMVSGKKAAGGPVHGPGTGTSDTAGLFALSNGEHVLTAAEVSAAGGHGAVEQWRSGLVSGAGHKATGGAIGTDPGTTVSTAYLLAQLGATSGPVDGSRYAAALAVEASTAAAAAAAEAHLNQVRDDGKVALDQLKDQLSALEDAQDAQADAAIDGMERQLDALKAVQDAETDRLKQAQDDALTAFQRQQEDELDALKARDAAEIDALRSKKGSEAAVAAASARNDAAEKALQRKQEDAETAFKRGQDAAQAALEQQHADAVSAAQDQITAAKDRNTQASKELKAADEDRIQQAEDDQANAEAAAEAALTAAKDQDTAATQELKDATDELNEARQKALDLASKIADQVTSGFSLDDLVTGGSAASILAAADKQVARAKELSDSIGELMAEGLNSTLVDQITAKGTAGLDVARRLLAGGPDLVTGLNGALSDLTGVGNDLGSYVSAARYAPTTPVPLTSYGTLGGGSVAIDAGSITALAAQVTTALASRPLVLTIGGKQVQAVVNDANAATDYRRTA